MDCYVESVNISPIKMMLYGSYTNIIIMNILYTQTHAYEVINKT